MAIFACSCADAYPVRCIVEEGFGQSDSSSNCARVTAFVNCGTAYGGTYVDCATCNSGFTRAQVTVSIGSETLSYYTCQGGLLPIVQCPSACTSESWTSAGSGKEVRCVMGISSASCEYRCAANYYGNGTTCTACPSYNSIAGTSSAGSTSASSCCIASGSTYSFSDTVGSGTAKISSKCCAS